jgi:type IV secretion system protein VirB1
VATTDAYPEPYAIRKYLPSTPLSVTATAMANARPETAESRPAIPVPGPGAILPQVSRPVATGISQIPTQVVGVNGDPYQTRIVQPTPTTGLPGNQLPLPNPDAPMSSSAIPSRRNTSEFSENKALPSKKGGTLLHSTESSAKAENKAAGNGANGDSSTSGAKPERADNSFVF